MFELSITGARGVSETTIRVTLLLNEPGTVYIINVCIYIYMLIMRMIIIMLIMKQIKKHNYNNETNNKHNDNNRKPINSSINCIN